jgi:immunity protein 52 of polymorphic toxin system
MEVNKFTIFSSWEPRAETPEQLGQRTLRNLDALSGISPLFEDWWFLDLHRSMWEMNENTLHEFLFPLEEVRPRMTKMVELGVRKNDDGKPEPAGGYSISVSNCIGDSPQCATLSAHGGGVVDPRAGRRNADFETSCPELVAYPLFKAVLKTIVSAWDVGYAQAYSDALRKLWGPKIPFYRLSWMTYLSPPRAAQIQPPADVIVEYTDDGGLLMIAAEETFDTANPQHMAGAHSILDALAPLNAEEDRLYAERFPPWRR